MKTKNELLFHVGMHAGRLEMLLRNEAPVLDLLTQFEDVVSGREPEPQEENLLVQTWFKDILSKIPEKEDFLGQTWFESLDVLSKIQELVSPIMTKEMSTEFTAINSLIKKILSIDASKAYLEKNYHELTEKNAFGFRLIDYLSVCELNFSVRTYNCLERNCFLYVGDIIAIPRFNFKKVFIENTHCGNRSAEEILDQMDALRDEVFGTLWS